MNKIRTRVRIIQKVKYLCKNIPYFIQGYYRYYLDRFNLLDPILKQEIENRKKLADPNCITLGKCVQCNCKTPQLFYANKQCGGECYPKINN